MEGLGLELGDHPLKHHRCDRSVARGVSGGINAITRSSPVGAKGLGQILSPLRGCGVR